MKVQLEGTEGLTLQQAEALLAAAVATLEWDEARNKAQRALTPKQARAAYDAVDKLNTAIQRHKELNVR